MSKNEHWLLVVMALGANLKISKFDPPSVGGTYMMIMMMRVLELLRTVVNVHYDAYPIDNRQYQYHALLELE